MGGPINERSYLVATKKINTKVIPVAPEIDPLTAPVDTETREDLGEKLVSVRDTYAYVNVALSLYMEKLWGTFSAVRTGTDTVNAKVWLYRSDLSEPGHVPVSRNGTQNSLAFSLFIPLQKLGIRPTSDRQWNLVPTEQPLTGTFPAFVLNMNERISVPRDLKAEETEAAKEKVAKAVAKKAEQLKKQLAKIGEADKDE
jgi:hypothetical protein